MKMKATSIVLGLFAVASMLAVSAVRGADKEGAKEAEGDVKKLEGKWTAPSGGDGKVTYTFSGTKLKVVAPSRSYEMTVTLDEKAKPDKTIDFKINEGPDDAKGKTSKGIYKFDGEKFVFCFRPMGDRPTKYETVGYEQIVVELTKDKDKDKK